MAITINEKIREIPPLKESVTMALEILDGDEVDYHTLEHVLNADPALVGLVLRLANSSFYGVAGKVASVREACFVLGVYTLRNILISAAIAEQFPEREDTLLNRNALWNHMRGVAVCARVFALKVGVDANRAFTAGLLHDIGKLVLDHYYTEETKKVIAYRDANNSLLRVAEEEILGVDHCYVGSVVAKSWGFPDEVVAVIAHHHAVEKNGADTLVSIVQIADTAARALKLGNGGDDLIPPVEMVAVKMVGWDGWNVPEVIDEIFEMYSELSGLMNA